MADNYFDQFHEVKTGNYFDRFHDDSEESRFSYLVGPEYSAVRSGAVDFIESAVGAGDELDAVIRLMSGTAKTWDEAITASRGELRAFQEDNPTASNILSVAGFASGLLYPEQV